MCLNFFKTLFSVSHRRLVTIAAGLKSGIPPAEKRGGDRKIIYNIQKNERKSTNLFHS